MEGSGKIFLGRRCLHINHGRPSPPPLLLSAAALQLGGGDGSSSPRLPLLRAVRGACVRRGELQNGMQPPVWRVFGGAGAAPGRKRLRPRCLTAEEGISLAADFLFRICTIATLNFSTFFFIAILASHDRPGAPFSQMCWFY